MKLALSLLFAAAAFAQVPAHSVVGNVTIDIADVSIPVSYGSGMETRAAISVCSNLDSTYAFVDVTYSDQIVLNSSAKLVKVDAVYCGVFLAATRLKDIAGISMQESRVTSVTAPPPAPAAATAAQSYRRK